jgi:hypothetical protein
MLQVALRHRTTMERYCPQVGKAVQEPPCQHRATETQEVEGLKVLVDVLSRLLLLDQNIQEAMVLYLIMALVVAVAVVILAVELEEAEAEDLRSWTT